MEGWGSLISGSDILPSAPFEGLGDEFLLLVEDVAAVDYRENENEYHYQAVNRIGHMFEECSLAFGHVYLYDSKPRDLHHSDRPYLLGSNGMGDDTCGLIEVGVGLGIVPHGEVTALLLERIEVDLDVLTGAGNVIEIQCAR